MKYSLKDIYAQALQDTYALALDGDGYDSRMVYGTKIIKDLLNGEIQILNTARGGDYYSHLTPEQLNNFLVGGMEFLSYLCLTIVQSLTSLSNESKNISMIKSLRSRYYN
jgi:hypothetical protein